MKKEPSSPVSGLTASRHRPPKLALAQGGPSNITSQTPRTGNLTATGVMQEVGLACLSPGFNTQDPALKEQLQRSMSVREQQRSIIEQRLQRNAQNGEVDSGPKTGRGSKRRPPAGLSIVPPSHRQFANERIVQSAPLNQTFTGRDRPPPHLAQQHQQLAPQPQHVNRLPPIADVISGERMDIGRTPRYEPSKTTSTYPPPMPAYPSPNHGSTFQRPREYRSAEEAIASMTSGREELRPIITHYGGHQPPTPPSPTQAQIGKMQNGYPTSRRRGRGEYERDGSYGSDDNSTKRRKKDEKKEQFMALMSQAWDLLHS